MENEVVKEWIRLAEMDRETAKYLQNMRPKPIEIICFLCQQASEKMLKAFLVKNEKTPPKTHNLIILNNYCEELSSEFRKIKDECGRLNYYSVQPRYPDVIEILESDMQLAISDMERIVEFVENKI